MRKIEASEELNLAALLIERLESPTEIRSRNTDKLQLYRAIEKSCAGSILRQLVKYIPKEILLATMCVELSDFSKLVRRKKLNRNQADTLNDLTLTWSHIQELFGSDQQLMDQWISEELPILRGHKVRDLLLNSQGRVFIRELTHQMLSGELA